jgi:streptogramin lyase
VVVVVLLTLGPVAALATTPSFAPAIALYKGPAAPVGVAVSATGTVYWTNYNTGQLLSLPAGATSPTILLSGLSRPAGLVVDSSGDLYFSEQQAGRVSELLSGSSTPTALFSANLVSFIAVDQSGNVYYVQTGCNGQGYTNSIVEYLRASGQTKTVLAPMASVGNNPSYGQVFINSAGLYFTTCTGEVDLLATGAQTPQVLVSGLQAGPTVSSNGVTADAQGDVFFTNYWNSVEMLPTGSSSPLMIATAGGTHYGIALDTVGDVYYTDNLGGTIWTAEVQPSNFTQLVQAFDDLNAQYTALNQEYSQLVSAYNQLASNQQSLTGSYANQTKTYAELASQLANLTQRYSQLSVSQQSLAASYVNQTKAYTDLASKYNVLSSSLNGLSSEYTALSQSYSGLSSSYQHLSNQLTQYQMFTYLLAAALVVVALVAIWLLRKRP